jgi:hypothetical protein
MRSVFSAAGTFDAALVPAALWAALGAGVSGAADKMGAAGLTAVLVGGIDPLHGRAVSGIPYLSMRPASVNRHPSSETAVWNAGQVPEGGGGLLPLPVRGQPAAGRTTIGS